ncbi:hypothetical protein [Phenylobacterium sp.]|uniref:hypothetical protein n=1 Tax=Phenylobacterium sp. TaxID=1871053 RepID=UPI00281164B4|nr:hypothetical protein [Phenylobacterium sp.]
MRLLVGGAATLAPWRGIGTAASVPPMEWRPLGLFDCLAAVLGGLALGAALSTAAILAATLGV